MRASPGLAFALGALLVPVVALGQTAPPPAKHADSYSAYEQQAIDDALKRLHARIDRSPEGKTIEGLDVVTLDVFEPRDPVPVFFDVFHTTSKRYVIERQVLLRPGDAYSENLVDDTVRNLRLLPELSLVLLLPVEGSAPGRVRLLVITKDVWSLRPNWNFQIAPGGLALLSAQPAETNLAGTHTNANLNFVLQPASLTLGAGYTNYRVDGTRVELSTNANVVWTLPSGAPEGTYGALTAGQPLYSPLTKWAWDANVGWVDYIVRRYENTVVAPYFDLATGESIPFEYRSQQYDSQYTLTRSFGWATKQDVTLGVSVSRSQYITDFTDVPGVRAQTVRDFVTAYVPVSDNRVGPFIQYHTYLKRYVRLLDFETLGLQEDYRLGPEAFVNVYPVLQALGSSRDFFGVDLSAQYTIAVGDGLARATIESITEAQSESLADASIEPSLHLVSPTVVIGRFVFDTHLLYRYRNYMNQVAFLGGDGRLRGYPTNFFAGTDVLSSNLEFRTRSIDILTAQAGLVAFYDVGDAFNGWSKLRPYDSVGFGGRILFPQLDRLVLRGDVGFPVGDGARLSGVSPWSFFIALSQAFGVPQVNPGNALSGASLTGSPSTAISAPP